MVDDDVVARVGHARHGPVEAHGGAHELGRQVLVADLALGAHGMDGIDRQVEPGAVQDLQELGGDARLARARGAVEQDDRSLSGHGGDLGVGAVHGVARGGGWRRLWGHGADSAVTGRSDVEDRGGLSVVECMFEPCIRGIVVRGPRPAAPVACPPRGESADPVWLRSIRALT
ncbi:MAG TPA: hypothetical protein VF825_06015 [Oryzihumus sp.]